MPFELRTRTPSCLPARLVDFFPPDRSRELCGQLAFALSFFIARKLVV